jgi:hypothetical protein
MAAADVRQRRTAADPSSDAAGDDENNAFLEALATEQAVRRRNIDVVANKVHAVFWVGLAVLAVYYTRLWDVLLHDTRIARGWFNAGVVFLAVQVVLVLYLTVWLRYVMRITLEWEAYCPRVLQASIATGAVAFVCFVLALWPVFGLLTIPFLLLLIFALIMFTHLMPIVW